MGAAAPIRTAIVGFGTAGRLFHAPFLAHDPAFSVDVIVTRDPDRQVAARAEHRGALLLETTDELWQRAGDVDLVVIASPSGTHAGLARRALEAGLHVVVDKPFSVTSSEGRELIALAEQAERVLTVFQNRRWDGDFLTLRALIAAGELGAVHRFESRFEWWQPAPEPSWKTRATASDGGGILYDLGTHLVDQALQLFGPVADVHAEIARRRRDVAADDDVFLALTHTDGVRSHLWMSAVAARPGPRFHVLGDRAAYTTWGLDPQEPELLAGRRPGDPGFGVTPPERWGELGAGEETRRVETRPGDYGAFARGLAAAILTGAAPPVDPVDAVAVLEILEHVRRVAR